MKLLTAVLTLATLAACAGFNTRNHARWPYRGPMLMVTNPTSAPLVVRARDGMGRETITTTIKPNGKECFRWPFIHAIGYLIAAGSDTLTTEPFEPWSADGWEWAGQFEPVSNPKACQR